MSLPRVAILIAAAAQGDPTHASNTKSKPLVSIKVKWPWAKDEVSKDETAKADSAKPSQAQASPKSGNAETTGASYFPTVGRAGDLNAVGNGKTVGEPAVK